MSDTRSPDLDARLSEDVEKAARAIHGGKGCTCRLGAKGDALAVLSAANHAGLLTERDRLRAEKLALREGIETLLKDRVPFQMFPCQPPEGREIKVIPLDRTLCDIAAVFDALDRGERVCPDCRGGWSRPCARCNKTGWCARASSLETDTEDGGRDE